jgi:UDP-N-acetylglucosamine acyltransferase
MAYAHVAHDVRFGNHTQLGNAVTFAGHVVVEDWAVIEAFSGVHQFCRIGKHAFVGGYSVVTKDVLPFSMTVSPSENRRCLAKTKSDWSGAASPRKPSRILHKAFRLLTKSGLNTRTGGGAHSRGSGLPGGCDLLAFMERSERGFVK